MGQKHTRNGGEKCRIYRAAPVRPPPWSQRWPRVQRLPS
jgi:hypothetical protein